MEDGQHMLEPWSQGWLSEGMTVDGALYPLPKRERPISENGGGFWHIPTPTSADVYTGNLKSSQQSDDSMHSVSLPDFVNRWPTPSTMDHIDRKHMRPSRAATNRTTGYLSEMIGQRPTPRGSEGGVGIVGGSGHWQMLQGKTDTYAEALAMGAGNGGSLSPDWVSWLMGLPVGWTSLEPMPRREYLDWLHAQLDGTWWHEERGLPRVATGVKDRVNRLKALGNGIVPASLALFLRR